MEGAKIICLQRMETAMGRSISYLLPLVLVLLMASGSGLAHAPVDPEDGGSLATATRVDDPAKSWAIYGELDGGGDTWYFKIGLERGDRLRLSLLTTSYDLVPDLIVMGKDLLSTGALPEGVDVPAGYGWVLLEGTLEPAEYEPFTPGSYYHVVEYDDNVTADGAYYVAVHSDHDGGPFSLVVGYVESFTVVEWLSLPASLIGVYRWEGQGWAAITGPAIGVIVVGLAVIAWFQRRGVREMTVFQWTSTVAGLLILAWAAIVVYQMLRALDRSGWSSSAVVTMGFIAGSVAMGIYAFLPAFRGPVVPDQSRRVGMFVVGVVALFLYTGLYVGPVLALVSALIPSTVAVRTLVGPTGDGSPSGD